ncbi:protein of unknown function [Prevotellaceae bacterium MN60]|nr:protein of unknown function [Prevotellaceae bacterium MN60]
MKYISNYFGQTKILAVLFLLSLTVTVNAFPLLGKKKAKKEIQDKPSKYKTLTGRDSVKMCGVMNVIERGDSILLEMPVKLMGHSFLVHNKLQQVPAELNEASANKGVNYESLMVRFEWNKQRSEVVMREQRVTPEAPMGSQIAQSVADNYIDPILATLKVAAVSSDSTTVIFNVSDLFDGKKNILNDVFNQLSIGTSADRELSRIISVKAYDRSVVARSELTTVVHEGTSKVNLTVVVSTALLLLPDEPMQRRQEDWRVGYFSTPSLQYTDEQQRVKRTNYITRWRLEPSDTAAYMRGELVTPKKPITFYIDRATPQHLRPYIMQGITDWNRAFERAGFKDAVRALVPDDTLDVNSDDLSYSVLTYAASEKANAMGPSTIDPRTGEILEADIIWWHNVQSLISEWIVVQTGAVNPKARTLNLPEDLIGDAVRFVACHEVGHSLGLRHNMIASAAYPTDSLRSASFMVRVGGTSASIMDYARFNYVAQPGDGVKVLSPNIGAYDLMAIEWGYRWYPADTDEKKELAQLLGRHQGKEYRFSEQQAQRTAVDPRAMSEDLGDDPVKSAQLGIKNLKVVMNNLVSWTRNAEPEQNYDEAARLYSAVIGQWCLYLYHVMANVGGMYLERPMIDTENLDENIKPAYTFVEKERQRQSVQFLLDEVLCFPEWLFGNEQAKQLFILRKTPMGTVEQEPTMLLKNYQNYILWDLLVNERLIRMYQNEWSNGSKAFSAVDMMQMLHQHIFGKTIAGKSLNVMERSLQKSLVDALMTAAAEQEAMKLTKSLCGEERSLDDSGRRIIDMTTNQISRTSDALSVKRGELLRIMKLLKSRRASGDLSTQMHYEDVILRIQTALGLQK